MSLKEDTRKAFEHKRSVSRHDLPMHTEVSSPVAAQGPELIFRFKMRFSDSELEAAFLDAHRKDSLQIIRWGMIVALALIVAFIWEDQDLSPVGHRATNIRLYLGVPLCLVVWYVCGRESAARYIEQITLAFLWLLTCVVIAITLVFQPSPHGLSGELGGGNFIVILMGTFTLTYLRFHLALVAATGILALYSTAIFIWGTLEPIEFLTGHFSIAIFTSVVGATSNFLFERLRRRQFLMSSKLLVEKERYRQLLYDLVPNEIANRIEAGEFPIADSHAEVAILFADLVGFTSLTKEVPPRVLVRLLNELFTEYDRAAEYFNVEKIKTIGDGYMAACGPPVEEDSRTVRIIEMAKEMIAITKRIASSHGIQINIRVGVHTGSLVAGVIGRSRYTYDMWGESVNMASRMESSGVTNRIHLSEEAYRRVCDLYSCEKRGEITIKGIGNVKTYLIAESEMNLGLA